MVGKTLWKTLKPGKFQTNVERGVTGKAFIWQKSFDEDRHFLPLVTQTEQQFYCEAGPVADAPGEHRSNP